MIGVSDNMYRYFQNEILWFYYEKANSVTPFML